MQNGMFFKMFKTIRRTKTRHFAVASIVCFSTVCRGRNNTFARAVCSWAENKNCYIVPRNRQFFMSLANMVSVYFANTMLINKARPLALPFKHEFEEFSLARRKFIEKVTFSSLVFALCTCLTTKGVKII